MISRRGFFGFLPCLPFLRFSEPAEIPPEVWTVIQPVTNEAYMTIGAWEDIAIYLENESPMVGFLRVEWDFNQQ